MMIQMNKGVSAAILCIHLFVLNVTVSHALPKEQMNKINSCVDTENCIPGVCCNNVKTSGMPTSRKQHTITTREINQRSDAKDVALYYCQQYAKYKYAQNRKEPDPTGESIKSFGIDAGAARRRRALLLTATLRPRIGGGDKAEAGEFPHMALIGYKNSKNKENPVSWNCGGSLISEKFILTAAHCISGISFEPPKWVLLGDININSVTDDKYRRVYFIMKTYIHPDYQKKEPRQSDIALIELKEEVQLSPYVRPACLHTSTFFPVGTEGVITGWGKTGASSRKSDDLLKATIKVAESKQCETKYTKNPFNSTTMICAGDILKGRDHCAGDSGGPLQTRNKKEIDMWDIFGVISFGPGICANMEDNAVYINVAIYLDWIRDIVWP